METLAEPVLLKKQGMYEIWFVPLFEDMSLEDTFEPSDIPDLIYRLNNFDAVYFCAKVYAKFRGVELHASDYLGACYYDSFEEFYEGNDYIIDMINEVEKEAKKRA
jgi:hypothetical protein